MLWTDGNSSARRVLTGRRHGIVAGQRGSRDQRLGGPGADGNCNSHIFHNYCRGGGILTSERCFCKAATLHRNLHLKQPARISMSDYTIYALKGANDTERDEKTYKSLQEGVGRFGWSYVETADLKKLQATINAEGWDSLTPDQKDCYHPFLLDIKEGDYVVYINIPEWGKCTLARVTGPYFWSWEDGDFNHRFHVDPESVRHFDRNDAIVHPALSRRLKLQGRYWHIYLQKEFESLVDSLKKGTHGQLQTDAINLNRFKDEILPDFESITNKIHHVYPGSSLEKLIADVFRSIPGVKEVQEQGGRGEHGADLKVIFEWEVPILGIQEERKWVVQVKSFEGEMWATEAADQIQHALEYWKADVGIIVSTSSSSSEVLDKALETLRKDTGKPVILLIGKDVASFLLHFGSELLV